MTAPAAAERITNWVNSRASPKLMLTSTSSNGMYTGYRSAVSPTSTPADPIGNS